MAFATERQVGDNVRFVLDPVFLLGHCRCRRAAVVFPKLTNTVYARHSRFFMTQFSLMAKGRQTSERATHSERVV